jgi:hypothetical protein
MPWPQSAAPDLHLERARDCVGSSRLLGALTIGGGSGRPWGGSGEVICTFTAVRNSQKRQKKRAVSRTFWPINHRKRRFLLKSTFRRIHEFSSSLLMPLQSYTSSKFRKSYTPPAARIRVKISALYCADG